MPGSSEQKERNRVRALTDSLVGATISSVVGMTDHAVPRETFVYTAYFLVALTDGRIIRFKGSGCDWGSSCEITEETT